MMKTSANRWAQTISCLLGGVFACTGVAVLAADGLVEGGKELFQREWKHHPQEKIHRGDLSPGEFRQRLMKLDGDGLGPMYNATSCEACHAQGGGAGVKRNVTLLTIDPRSEILNARNRRSAEVRKELLGLYPGLLSPRGALSMDVVVHEKSARPFYDAIREQIAFHVPGSAPAEWYVSEKRTIEAVARQPVLAGRTGSIDFYLSQRNSPPLFGLGLIDKIDRVKLPSLARAQARHTNGQVTGRVGAGIFGWRAQTQTLDQFVRGACAGEVGLQVARTPQPDDAADETYVSLGFDLQEDEVNMLVSYVRALPKPIQEAKAPHESEVIRDGERLFTKVGCAVCHVEDVYPARGVYSDFLLHDMGELLQAPSPAPAGPLLTGMPRLSLPSFSSGRSLLPSLGSSGSINGYYGSPGSQLPRPYALRKPAEPRFPRGKVPKEVLETRDMTKVTWDMLQREWRTPPLWGVADSGPYLHDGRAATLDSAIRWHGGEASEAASGYRSLTKEGRSHVIAFLASLRSPPSAPRQDIKHVAHSVPSYVKDSAEDLDKLAEAVDIFQQ